MDVDPAPSPSRPNGGGLALRRFSGVFALPARDAVVLGRRIDSDAPTATATTAVVGGGGGDEKIDVGVPSEMKMI